ncbi:MAG: N-acyl amino acid synthase FeeM domain-containing protein [Aggregatilineales bacterium]
MVTQLEQAASQSSETSDLALVDAVCRFLISQNPAIRFSLAHTPADLEAVFRLRYREVIDRGWAQPSDFPDGLERDEYDEQAFQIVGWHGDDLAATARLVLPSPGQPLPTETIFGLTFQPHGQVAEGGRIVVAPTFRSIPRSMLLMGVTATMVLETRVRGLNELCFNCAEPTLRLYRQIGLHVAVLGPARRYFGADRYPCQIDLVASARSLSKRLKITAESSPAG